MNSFSVTHFIPLIGPWYMGCDKLNKTKEFKIDNKYVFSFKPFANNQQHLEANYNLNIDYLPDDLLPDYSDGTDNWKDMTSYKKYITDNNISSTDLLLAVPPCAGLSMLNAGNRGAGCAANKWMYETVKWHIAQGNKVLCLENAPGLVGEEGVKVLRIIQEILNFNNVGSEYKMHCTKTTTLNHGIPQKRDRAFLYIYKSNNFLQFKNIKNDNTKLENFLVREEKLNESINHIPINDETNSQYIKFLNDKNLWDDVRNLVEDFGIKTITSKLIELYNNDKNVFDDYPKIKKDLEHKIYKLSLGKGYWDSSPMICKGKVNAVISKNAQNYIHPKYNRLLTIRELMDLMGYPDTFKLVEPAKKNFNHVCQSLPINTGMDHIRWAQGIVNNDKKYIGINIEDDSINILLQNNINGNLENDIKCVRKDDTVFKDYKKNKKDKLKSFIE